ncbi:MAG: hypothetical protein MUF64_03870 [Polyangiaceae bacterium]|jgi:hypothetical protein|nr:hypothetical protein [Polyangiaceae bacterium]
MHLRLILGFSGSLLACAATPPPTPDAPPAPAPSASPAASCPGQIPAAPGLREVDDQALLQQALGKAGEGKLCAGKVFEATSAVTVYRVWNKSTAWTQQGRWWSLERPAGPVESYRQQNAICPEWSALDVVSACKLKVGARVVMGTGQSATCKETSFPASPVVQVFVPNDGKNGVLFVEGCSPGDPWP